MNAKRWFPWVCLALMLVSEIFLFRANHERDIAVADAKEARQKLQSAQTDLDNLKSSTSGQQATEIANLQKQNTVLLAKVQSLQQTVDKLQNESKQNAQHLTTARQALEMQQAHLQQIQQEQQAEQARATAIANANACINNLRLIDAAKTQWALDKGKTATDVPTVLDLAPYFQNNAFPACPDGGNYIINAVGVLPTCNIPGHVLAPQQ